MLTLNPHCGLQIQIVTPKPETEAELITIRIRITGYHKILFYFYIQSSTLILINEHFIIKRYIQYP